MIGIVRAGAIAGLVAAAAVVAPVGAQPQSQANLQGIWDLTWTTRHGPEQKGYLRIDQQGTTLRAQIHGRGSIDARGTVSGRTFELHGSRMLVPYRIEGRLNGDRLEGVLKVLSVERRFTGARRGG